MMYELSEKTERISEQILQLQKTVETLKDYVMGYPLSIAANALDFPTTTEFSEWLKEKKLLSSTGFPTDKAKSDNIISLCMFQKTTTTNVTHCGMLELLNIRNIERNTII